MGGSKVGYGQASMTREGDLIQTRTTFRLKLGRADQAVQIQMDQNTTESLDGRPRAFGSEMDASVMKTATKGTIADGKVTIITSQYGMEQKQVFDFPADALMSWGMYRESLLRGFKPGTTYTLRTYAPELRLDDAVSATTAVGDWEEFEHRRRKLKGQKVIVKLESPLGSMEMVSWIDPTGRPLKAKVPAPGVGDMEMIASDQATAMADFVPPEIFMTTAIKAGRKIDRAKVNTIKYRLASKDAAIDARLHEMPNTEMQRVTPLDGGAVEATVKRVPHRSVEPAPSALTNAERAEYLGDNLMMNTKDPLLQKLAHRATPGDESNLYAVADKLRRFVTEYVENKNLNIGFATASEVARTKEGDCSEHAVLLAALGRINGLPSRVVAGLAYVPLFGNEDDIFGYHMWTQFYIDGRWIDVDAALRETECSPARIAFAISSLQNAGLADLSLPLLSKIGAISLEIREME